MHHYAARQHSITERWAYTCREGGDIWPVGRCTEDGGHTSPEEACACYRQHLIEGAKFNMKMGDEMRCRVAGCKEMADEVALCAGATYRLCEEHQDEDFLEPLVPSVGTSIVIA